MTFYVYARSKGPCYENYIYYFRKDNEKQIQNVKVGTWLSNVKKEQITKTIANLHGSNMEICI